MHDFLYEISSSFIIKLYVKISRSRKIVINFYPTNIYLAVHQHSVSPKKVKLRKTAHKKKKKKKKLHPSFRKGMYPRTSKQKKKGSHTLTSIFFSRSRKDFFLWLGYRG